MPEQPNHCTCCGVLMQDTDAAYYCSAACMHKVRGTKPMPKTFDRERVRKIALLVANKLQSKTDGIPTEDGWWWAAIQWPENASVDIKSAILQGVREFVEDNAVKLVSSDDVAATLAAALAELEAK